MNLTKIINNYPRYQPSLWNKNKFIKKSHNCYSYALNLIYPHLIDFCKKNYNSKLKNEFCPSVRPQPGMYAGIFRKQKNMNVAKRMILDNPSIKPTTFSSECPSGYYKIALVFEENMMNYHFYRQDKNTLWSHKDGWDNATNKDKDGKLIYDPRKCNRGMYKIFYNFYIVPISSSLKNMACKHDDFSQTNINSI